MTSKPSGGDCHPVAVAHPHRIFLPNLPETVEQRAGFENFDIGAAKLSGMPAFDAAAKLATKRLLAVTDCKDRQATVDQALRRAGRAFGRHRSWPTRQDDAARLHPRKRFCRAVEGGDFAIDPGFADAPCDKLGHLTAEIDDQN